MRKRKSTRPRQSLPCKDHRHGAKQWYSNIQHSNQFLLKMRPHKWRSQGVRWNASTMYCFLEHHHWIVYNKWTWAGGCCSFYQHAKRRLASALKTKMAITFSDLHTESGLKSLDQYLSGKSYISGNQLTKDDIKVYAAVLKKPAGSFPNASRWYDSVSSHIAPRFAFSFSSPVATI